MNSKKRSPAADLIRILAFFSVVSVHFFLNNDYYMQSVEGKRMYVMTIMRSFFIICVPLFLTLSGYLLRNKKLEKSYYKRIGKIIITYVLASLVCVFYSVYYLHNEYTVRSLILGIFNFTAAPYSWYVEMYIGLFLLIPFLNIMYNGLPSQKWKIWLVITFVILTSLPAAVNVFDLNSFDWFPLPASSPNMDQIIPDWWQYLYPVTYYYIGCYLSEYGLKINKLLNFILIIVWTVISGTFCFWRSYKSLFIWGSWCNYQSLWNVVLTVLVFAFIININYDKMPRILSKIIQKISGLSLGAYLVSWTFDSRFYPVLAEKIPYATHRLEYYFIVVPVIFVLSLAVSYLISLVQTLIEKIPSIFCKLIKKENNNV